MARFGIPTLQKKGKGKDSTTSDGSYTGDSTSRSDSNSDPSSPEQSRASKQLSALTDKGKHIVNQAKDKARAKIEDQVDKLADKAVAVVIEKVSIVVKDSAKDESMPGFVKSAIDLAVDEVMEEVAVEMKAGVNEMVREGVGVDQGVERKCFSPWVLCWFRNLVLYYVVAPFDMSPWQQMRTFTWWFFKLVSLVPVRGVTESFFALTLLFEDKSDEFRLISYILTFRGTSFISVGVIPALIGAAMMANCGVRENSVCPEKGPRLEYFEAFFFVLQVVLLIIAFGLLPFSTKKGATRFKRGTPDEERGQCCGCLCGYTKNRGGALKYLVFWDIFIGLALIGLMYYIAFQSPEKLQNLTKAEIERKKWIIQGALYWVKVLYGLVGGFPYLLFQLPALGGILTHAKPTGYSRNGKCVPLMVRKTEAQREEVRKKMKEAQDKWDREKHNIENA
jgi:hypothetical protein